MSFVLGAHCCTWSQARGQSVDTRHLRLSAGALVSCFVGRYLQGMHEVLAPFVALSDPELPTSDISLCYSTFIKRFLPYAFNKDEEFLSLQARLRSRGWWHFRCRWCMVLGSGVAAGIVDTCCCLVWGVLESCCAAVSVGRVNAVAAWGEMCVTWPI